MTVQEYHALSYLSNSKLKLFRDDKLKFKKWLEQGIEPPQKRSVAATMGNGVDFMILRQDENWDDHFVTYKASKVTPAFLNYCDELLNVNLECLTDLGTVNTPFLEMMETAFNNVAYDPDTGEQIVFKRFKNGFDDKFIEAFNKNAADYFKMLRENSNKTVLTLKQYEAIEKLANNLRNHWVTRNIINFKNVVGTEVINQFTHVFAYRGETIKIMADKVFISKAKKKIVIYDLKTCYNQAGFFENFLKYGYYIQCYLYTIGMVDWAAQNNMKDFEVVPMQFIACPTTFFEDPLIITVSGEQLASFGRGFEVRGRKYRGVDNLIEDIKFCKKTGIWGMDREDYENKGFKKLEL